MVESIRNIEKALSGSGEKKPSKSEIKNKTVARKSIYLTRDIAKGDRIKEEYLLPLRPGDGISPMEWNNVIGKKVLEHLSKNEQLKWEHLQ
jgi:N-acetylneuraminate synthase/N,N'-diacetyllegionaminate synthase